MKNSFIALLLLVVLLNACTKEETQPTNNPPVNTLEGGWLVPVNKLILSQLPPDRIRSIDAPYFKPIAEGKLKANESVYIYRFGDSVKVYPLNVMGRHEIVNDRIGAHHFAITFCPRTGSALAWNRKINGTVSEFGVSGHLFNENLIPYDRNDTSYWSQMGLLGIKGNHSGIELENSQLLLTKAATAMAAFPDAMVLIDTSGQNCDSICNGSFKQGRDLGDPNEDGGIELPGGDLFGIIQRESALLFNYDNFGADIQLYYTNFKSAKVIVLGSEDLQFIVAFKDNTGDPDIKFTAVQNALPIAFEDNRANQYDLTGLAVSGPSAGKRFPAPVSYTAHSFAWDLFFNDLELY